ncbi:MAG: phosphodiester glycosidase family protein [Firmicutes bacterium]|nr:phosphodiester glycosidase family protein [Bacillota bacterium]
MKQKRKKWTFGAVTALALTVFTGYALLDTFVIPRSYGTVPQTVEVAAEEVQTAMEDNITVELTEYRENDTTIYAADVWVTDPSQLKTAFANGTYGKNVKDATSDIAKDADAILAVNGDFYGARNSGYVIRNGVLYRSTSSGAEDLVIYGDGSFGIIDEDDVTAEQLLEDGAVQVLSFGPALVTDGEISVTKNEEVGKAMASNPRTAIGIYEDGHYVFVVSDGRTDESEGLSLYELAEFLQELGVETAYNLDGGGSSTMVYQGEVVNNPTTSGNSVKERSVSDIVYIGY